MIIVFGLYIIGIVIYQIFGIPHDVEWSIYFDSLHYSFALSIAFFKSLEYGAYKEMYRLLAFIIMLVIVSQLLYIGLSLAEYKNQILKSEPYYFIPLLFMFILAIFILVKIFKKCQILKKD